MALNKTAGPASGQTIKSFRDDDLKSIKIPTAIEDNNISDRNLVTALNLIYEGIEIKAATPYIVKLLCSLAYYELRHKPDDKREYQRLFIDSFKQGQKQLYESRYPGGRFIEDPENFMIVLSKVDCDAKQPADNHESTDRADPNPELINSAQGDVLRQKAEKQTLDEIDRLKKLYAKVNNKNPIKKFPEHAKLSIKKRTYIGAWAYYNLRCVVKGSKSMLGWQSGDQGNKMHKLISSLYNDISEINEKFLPAFSDRGYNLLHQLMNCNSKKMHVRGVILRSYALYLVCINGRLQLHKQVAHIIEQLLIHSLLYHGLEVYTLRKELSDCETNQPGTIMRRLLQQKSNCLGSYLRSMRIHRQYECPDSVNENPQWAADYGNYIGGDYWKIARVIDSKYFEDMGIKGNELLISAIVGALRVKKRRIESSINFNSIGSEECKVYEKLGRNAAEEYTREVNRSRSVSFLDRESFEDFEDFDDQIDMDRDDMLDDFSCPFDEIDEIDYYDSDPLDCWLD